MNAASGDAGSAARIDELEVRLAFMDETLGALNGVVATQDRQILELASALRRVQSDVQALRGALSADPNDEPPPPHY